MPGVSASFDIYIAAANEGTSNLGTPSMTASIQRSLKLTPGNGAAGLADTMYTATRTVAASATDSIDVTGSLTNVIGQTVTNAKIYAIYVGAAAANTNNVVIGGAATNTFIGPFANATSKISLAPGEYIMFTSANGWNVTAATADILAIANSGAGSSVTYDIVMVGRSA